MAMKGITRHTLAENLRALLDKHDYAEEDLAEKADVSQKVINNMLHQRSAATIDTVEAVAGAFKLEAWQLLYSELTTSDPELTAKAAKVLSGYLSATPEGRDLIYRVAEREVEYVTSKTHNKRGSEE